MITAEGSITLRGTIVTVTGSPDASAIMVKDGRVAAVGGDEVVAQSQTEGINIVDLGDRVVVPGFVDPHVHLDLYAEYRGSAVDCRVPGVRTVSDVLDRLQEGLKSVPSGGWLRAYGNLFFEQKLAERRLPTRQELDRVSQTVPIVLHCGGHLSVLNSAALDLAQVERFLNGAAGMWGAPVIHLDSRGEPTGVVAEIDQRLPIPPVDAETRAARIAATYSELFTRYGVTTFGEMVGSLESVEAFDRVISNQKLAARGGLYAMAPSSAPLHEAAAWAASYESAAGSDLLFACGVKIFADGGFSSRNAATRTPYIREHAPRAGFLGTLNLTQRDILEAIKATRQLGVQLAIHAAGVRAQDEVIAAVLLAGAQHDHLPVRIEHAGNMIADRADLDRWRNANILPVLQPGFLYNFVADFLPILFGTPATSGRLPLRTMLDDGIWPAASSDAAGGAEDQATNPLYSIWECMARRSYWGLEIEPEEAITFAEALRMHTLEPARALGMADRIGSLEVGKYGDMVVLSKDPRRVELDEIPSVAVDKVYLAGHEVYKRHAPAGLRVVDHGEE